MGLSAEVRSPFINNTKNKIMLHQTFFLDYIPKFSSKYPELNGFFLLYGLHIIEDDYDLTEAAGELEVNIFDVIFI